MNEISVAHVKFYRGKLNSKEVVLTQSGIGKVNVFAISTTLLIEKFNPKLIINTGSALDESLSVGDMLISNDVVYHDVDATAFGYNGSNTSNAFEFKSDQELLKSVETVINKNYNAKLAKLLAVIAFIGSVDHD